MFLISYYFCLNLFSLLHCLVNSSIEIKPLDYSKSFEQLTVKEKNFTYYLNKACWAGIPISLFQISYESPALFIIFQNFFSSFENIDNLEEQILKNENISKSDFNFFILYAVNFYSYYGNQLSYLQKKGFLNFCFSKYLIFFLLNN